MYHKIAVVLLLIFVLNEYIFSDTCDCNKIGSQRYYYEDAITSININSSKTVLCIYDTLKISLTIVNKSTETISVFKDTKITYKDKIFSIPQILVNLGNGFTSNIEYTVEMVILKPGQSRCVEIIIPVSNLLERGFDKFVYIHFGYGYLTSLHEIKTFSRENDKYFAIFGNELNISSATVELFNNSFNLAIMWFKLVKE